MESSVRLGTDTLLYKLEPLGVGGGVGKPGLSPACVFFWAAETVEDAVVMLFVVCPFLCMNLLVLAFFGESLLGILVLSCKLSEVALDT